MPELTQHKADQWFVLADSVFTSRDAWSEIGVHDDEDKNYWRQIINRWTAEGKIESLGKGVYRKKDNSLEDMDWTKKDDPALGILWPFELHRYVEMYSGMAVIAGQSNAGKSAFCLMWANLNHGTGPELTYFNNEMGVQQFTKRLRAMGIEPPPPFRVKNRRNSFEDVIDPDGYNVIDYLEVPSDAFLLPSLLDKIWAKLRSGFALVALQKPAGRDVAFGGDQTLNRPQLYLSLNYDHLKVTKAKTPLDGQPNITGWQWKFKLNKGCFFDDIERIQL